MKINEKFALGIPRKREYDKKQKAYDGKWNPPRNLRQDGNTPSCLSTNWCKYLVTQLLNFTLGREINYSLEEGIEDERSLASFENLQNVFSKNNVNLVDLMHLHNCLIYGESIELHSFVNKEIVISPYSPMYWTVIDDNYGVPKVAILKTVVQKGTFYNGAILEQDLVIYTEYDEQMITEYMADQSGEFVITDLKQHYYGRLPVVVFKANQCGTSILTEDIIQHNEAYNVIQSLYEDELLYNKDAFLSIKGINLASLYETDENGITLWAKVLQNRIIGSEDAKFITKNTPVNIYEFGLKTIRETIHILGSVVDVEQIIGSTGTASGIALKLKYAPMLSAATSFENYLEPCIEERIDLIMAVFAKLSMPVIESDMVEIAFDFSIPANSLEIWQGAASLRGIISNQDIIKLLPEVPNTTEAVDEPKVVENNFTNKEGLDEQDKEVEL